jgi:hypothetical protein
MLKGTLISRSASGSFLLDHNVIAGTYSSAPTLATDGFYIHGAAGRNYDAYEINVSMDATATILTRVNVRPWFWVPAHDPTGLAGGTW